MNAQERKAHWEKIYSVNKPESVSWYEPVPKTSLYFLEKFNIPKSAKIIDIGGGESFLTDNLLERGFNDVSVLDVSGTALQITKKRLNQNSSKVSWIESDITQFEPNKQYDVWHDRALFHFLITDEDIRNYIYKMNSCLKINGKAIIATFSTSGPLKCSGLDIKQYSENLMTETFKEYFDKLECIYVDHITPFETKQNFIYCSFKKVRECNIHL